MTYEERVNRRLQDLGRALQDMGRPLSPVNDTASSDEEDQDVLFVTENIGRILRGLEKLATR